MEIQDDYVKITLTNKLTVTPYNSEDVKWELEDVFYNSDGSKYVICERSEIESAKKRLIQPFIDKYQREIKESTRLLDFFKSL